MSRASTAPGWTAPTPELVPRTENGGIDRYYWLAHCEGYLVDSPGGRVGLVERVLRVEGERPEALVILAGMYGRRRLTIPVNEVDVILPYAQRVLLRSSASIHGNRAGRAVTPVSA